MDSGALFDLIGGYYFGSLVDSMTRDQELSYLQKIELLEKKIEIYKTALENISKAIGVGEEKTNVLEFKLENNRDS